MEETPTATPGAHIAGGGPRIGQERGRVSWRSQSGGRIEGVGSLPHVGLPRSGPGANLGYTYVMNRLPRARRDRLHPPSVAGAQNQYVTHATGAVRHLAAALLLLLGAACGAPASVDRIAATRGDAGRTNDGSSDVMGPADGRTGGPVTGTGGVSGAGGSVVLPGMGGAGGTGIPDAMPDVPVVAPVDMRMADDVRGPMDVGMPPDAPSKAAVGVACQQQSQCASNFCVDGVCCKSDCAGNCRTCSAAGSLGTCQPAAAGTDPRHSCNDQGAMSCGTTGFCDQNQACARYPATTVCSPLACSSTGQLTISRCDGAGTCVAAAPMSWSPYACTTTGSCRTFSSWLKGRWHGARITHACCWALLNPCRRMSCMSTWWPIRSTCATRRR